MTDKVIQALECISGKDVYCEDCSYSALYRYNFCMKRCAKDAIDLINRQQAEIERLQGQYKFLENNSLIFKGGIDYFKTDAIKDFAEKLTDTILDKSDRSLDNPNGNDYFISDVIEDIANLAKEMVGK